MSLSNAPQPEEIVHLAPAAHRSVVYNHLPSDSAWLILVHLNSTWGLYGARRNEHEARLEASRQQYRTASPYAVMPYSDLAAYDEFLLEEAKRGQ